MISINFGNKSIKKKPTGKIVFQETKKLARKRIMKNRILK
jgi:hypothetical protein